MSGLLNDSGKREQMAAALRKMAVSDASEQIYQTLLGLMKRK